MSSGGSIERARRSALRCANRLTHARHGAHEHVACRRRDSRPAGKGGRAATRECGTHTHTQSAPPLKWTIVLLAVRARAHAYRSRKRHMARRASTPQRRRSEKGQHNDVDCCLPPPPPSIYLGEALEHPIAKGCELSLRISRSREESNVLHKQAARHMPCGVCYTQAIDAP